MALIGVVVSSVHLMASLLFAAFGLHRLLYAWTYWRRIHPATGEPHWAPRAFWPLVTVQIPLYNERYVADRVIGAVGRLDYPVSALEIQVIDDSTDETSVIVSRAVAQLRAQGLTVHELRPGFTPWVQGRRSGGGTAVCAGGVDCDIRRRLHSSAGFPPARGTRIRRSSRRDGPDQMVASQPQHVAAHKGAGAAARCALQD